MRSDTRTQKTYLCEPSDNDNKKEENENKSISLQAWENGGAHYLQSFCWQFFCQPGSRLHCTSIPRRTILRLNAQNVSIIFRIRDIFPAEAANSPFVSCASSWRCQSYPLRPCHCPASSRSMQLSWPLSIHGYYLSTLILPNPVLLPYFPLHKRTTLL